MFHNRLDKATSESESTLNKNGGRFPDIWSYQIDGICLEFIYTDFQTVALLRYVSV